ncbi:MAG: NAD-binding protein [Gammaproteobacteria bacterium]|jgi:voltage-gated potassium channel|nr:NAD-binding protein [Gammaproteobacteria bacterium]MBP6052920.1 NAD-binding protein [Pseudomonadales bacterium]MBK6581964.1 NAD-binding protein [Gammaproteobacteria bacterium]MBK7170361.1 NAD-binding protein [Gammaproteobacteria bacterium]MBK7728290.1 NAD-binding protein [Gammaproteobacteria bacterium]
MRSRLRKHTHAARYRPPSLKHSALPRIVRRIVAASLFLVVVIVCSTIGFYLAGGGQATFMDAFYMSLITVSTVGYNEVMPLVSAGDRIFAGMASIVGFGALTFLFTSLSMFFLEQDLDHTLWRRRMEKQIRKLSQHYIVCGFGRVGRNAADELRLTGRQFVAIDLEQAKFNEHHERFPELLFLDGDASDDAVLLAADIEDAAGVFAVTGDDSRNLMITFTARQLNPKIRVVARAHEVQNIEKMRRAGADDVISPDFTGGMRIASAMIRPHVVSFLDEMLHSDHGLRVEQVVIPERFPPTRLSSLRLRCPEYVLLAVRDGNDWAFNPGDDYLLSSGQVLIAMASSRGRAEIEAHVREFLD